MTEQPRDAQGRYLSAPQSNRAAVTQQIGSAFTELGNRQGTQESKEMSEQDKQSLRAQFLRAVVFAEEIPDEPMYTQSEADAVVEAARQEWEKENG